MTSLRRTYGRTLTALFLLLCALWVVGMVVVPQLFMIEQSLWVKQAPADAFEITSRIDRLYSDSALLDLDRTDALAAEGAGSATVAGIDARIAEIAAEIADLERQEVTAEKVYTFDNYTRMSRLHVMIFVKTIGYAALVTALALVVCYPVAFTVAHLSTPNRAAILMLGLIIPYAINELLRVYAWLMILDYQGVINGLLGAVGLIALDAGQGIPFLESPAAVFMAMVYAYVLFMVFPIYNTVETLDRNQIEAARDLGAATWRIHWRVVIPHAKPGIAVGCIMTFMLSAGSYSVPQIMTRGKGGDWFSQLIYRQFFDGANWNVGAAYSFTLLLACVIFIFVTMRAFKVGVRDIAK